MMLPFGVLMVVALISVVCGSSLRKQSRTSTQSDRQDLDASTNKSRANVLKDMASGNYRPAWRFAVENLASPSQFPRGNAVTVLENLARQSSSNKEAVGALIENRLVHGADLDYLDRNNLIGAYMNVFVAPSSGNYDEALNGLRIAGEVIENQSESAEAKSYCANLVYGKSQPDWRATIPVVLAIAQVGAGGKGWSDDFAKNASGAFKGNEATIWKVVRESIECKFIP